jgi:hypothetical protein
MDQQAKNTRNDVFPWIDQDDQEKRSWLGEQDLIV